MKVGLIWCVLTSALDSRGRPEGGPQGLGAPITAGRHVERDLDKLVAFQDHSTVGLGVVVELLNRGRGVLIGFARLALPSIKHLKVTNAGETVE